MEFNKIIRGAKRQVNTEQDVYDILDAGFMCTIAFSTEGQTMMIPTAYGRFEDIIYFHGSSKNNMLNTITNDQTICVSITHLDGIVLAKTLFDTSANYRSVILFGKASLVLDETEKMEGLKIITDNIIPGRWEEVHLGSENELKATSVVKFTIEKASAKIRNCGPQGDDDKISDSWSGHIPIILKALTPIPDIKFETKSPISKSVIQFLEKYAG